MIQPRQSQQSRVLHRVNDLIVRLNKPTPDRGNLRPGIATAVGDAFESAMDRSAKLYQAILQPLVGKATVDTTAPVEGRSAATRLGHSLVKHGVVGSFLKLVWGERSVHAMDALRFVTVAVPSVFVGTWAGIGAMALRLPASLIGAAAGMRYVAPPEPTPPSLPLTERNLAIHDELTARPRQQSRLTRGRAPCMAAG